MRAYIRPFKTNTNLLVVALEEVRLVVSVRSIDEIDLVVVAVDKVDLVIRSADEVDLVLLVMDEVDPVVRSVNEVDLRSAPPIRRRIDLVLIALRPREVRRGRPRPRPRQRH